MTDVAAGKARICSSSVRRAARVPGTSSSIVFGLTRGRQGGGGSGAEMDCPGGRDRVTTAAGAMRAFVRPSR